MRCLECATENRAGAKFCAECGARLTLVCARCGTDLAPGARFCDAFGAQVAVPSSGAMPEPESAVARALECLVPQAFAQRLLALRGQVAPEHRTVTILFSDIGSSTALAESLDPEEVLDILNGAFEVLIAPITRYEGTLAPLLSVPTSTSSTQPWAKPSTWLRVARSC